MRIKCFVFFLFVFLLTTHCQIASADDASSLSRDQKVIKTTTIAIKYLLDDDGVAFDPDKIYVGSDSLGIKRFMLNGKIFIPVCVNYLIESTVPYKTFDMFDTRNFDITKINHNMEIISANGFNCVRLWLKGYDTDNGFSSTKEGPFNPKVWQQYVTNIDAAIQSAKHNNLRVILTGAFPGPNSTLQDTNQTYVPLNYVPPVETVPGIDAVNGFNRILLIPKLTDALAQFYSDLLGALVSIDPKVGDSFLYFDLYNETRYDLLCPPLSRTSGTFEFKDVEYDLSDRAGRQLLMDTATTHFIATLGSAVKRIIPGTLVTASSGFNIASGHFGFDGGMPPNPPKANTAYSYMLRPAYELAGGADIIDIHVYPGPGSPGDPNAHPPVKPIPPSHEYAATAFATDEIVGTDSLRTPLQISAKVVPLIAGEYGVELKKWGVTAPWGIDVNAAQSNGIITSDYQKQYSARLPVALSELQKFEQTGLCALNFSGFAIWDLGNNTNVPEGTFSLTSPYDSNSLMMKTFAPKYNNNFCGHGIDPSR